MTEVDCSHKKIIVRPIMLAYYIMIFVTIFNSNKYHAALSFILYPLILSIGLSLLVPHWKTKKLQQYLPIALICILTIFSTGVSDVVSWSMSASSFIIFAMFYVILTINDFEADKVKSILKFYAYLTILISAWLLINLILSNNLINGRVSVTILGARKDENYLSAYLVFGFFYFLSSYFWGSKKKKYLLYAGMIFIAVFMTGSRGALITMLIVFAIIIIKFIFSRGINGSTLAMSVGMIFILIIAYVLLSHSSLFARMSDVEGYTDNIRLTIWGYAIEAFLRKPLIGSGIQSGTYFAQLHVRWYTHSCFIDLITSIGIIGALLFVWQYILYCRVDKGNRIFMVGMVIILFLPLMFINGFETATFWIPMVLCKLVSDFCKHDNYCEILM